MDALAACHGRHVYLDTNILIYAVEGLPEHAGTIGALFDRIDAGEVRATTSELTLAEALAKPLETGRNDIARLYEDMLSSAGPFVVLPVGRAILLEAAGLRARLKLRLPDAIHVATALAARCEIFLSNDRKIRLPGDLTLLRLA